MIFSSMFIVLITSLVLVGGGGVNDSNVTGSQIFLDPLYRLFIGGSQVAKIEEAPFVVALVMEPPDDPKQEIPIRQGLLAFCTGAIILERWVLTAAHCVESYFKGTKFQVVAGCSKADEFNVTVHPTSQIRDPVRVLRHPYFRLDPYSLITLGVERAAYDAGLIEVENFQFGPTVKSIQLWSKKWDGVQDSGDYFSTECTAYGWGLNSPYNISEDLRTGNFTVQHGTLACQCPPDAPRYRNSLNLNDVYERLSLCTGSISGKSLCSGDSGGPLVCNGLLAGVTRSGYTCYKEYKGGGETCGVPNLISEWTYVCPMLQWIHWKIPELPDLPTSCRSPPSVEASLVTPALLLVYSIVG